MGHLSKQDREIARVFRLANIFQDVASKELDLSKGVIEVRFSLILAQCKAPLGVQSQGPKRKAELCIDFFSKIS